MRVLYVTNHIQISRHSGGFINDYLNDLTFHGFYELWEEGQINEIVDSTPIISLYENNKSNISNDVLWGGFTTVWLIPQDTINRENILEKIEDRYFDLIVYGNIRRCKDYYDIIKQIYRKEQIIFLDGSDDILVDPIFSEGHYYKREFIEPNSFIKPITFSIPSCKITPVKTKKIKEFGTVIPGEIDTYIFENETDYYLDYRESYYGFTTKKAGWDCMRHYEILANYCMPYFWDLENCPKQCLFNFPKELVMEANNLADWDFDEERYFELLDSVFDYTKKKLTTKAIAKYILNTL